MPPYHSLALKCRVVAALSPYRHKQAASAGRTNVQLRWPAWRLSLMAPVRPGFLGEVHGALGEFHELPIDFRQPRAASIFYKSSLDGDTICPPAV
jgi:hypothetical protein